MANGSRTIKGMADAARRRARQHGSIAKPSGFAYVARSSLTGVRA
jgi:hypothetical protein